MIWRIFLFFLGLDVRVSQEVELEEEGEDGGGRESEAAGTSEDVMRRKQELKLDLDVNAPPVMLHNLPTSGGTATSEDSSENSMIWQRQE